MLPQAEAEGYSEGGVYILKWRICFRVGGLKWNVTGVVIRIRQWDGYL